MITKPGQSDRVELSKNCLWQLAKFKKLINTPTILALRLIFTSLAILSVIIAFLNLGAVDLPVIFTRSLLNLLLVFAYFYLIFEAYYFFGLLSQKPKTTVSHQAQNSQPNVTETLSLASQELITGSQIGTGVDGSKLLKKMIASQLGHFVLTKADLDPNGVVGQINSKSVYDLDTLFSVAFENAKEEGQDYIEPSNLFFAVTTLDQTFKKLLFEKEVEFEDLKNIIFWYDVWRKQQQKSLSKSLLENPGIGADWSFGFTLSIEKFGRDLTSSIVKKKLNLFLQGRDREISQVEKILVKSKRANVLLVGPAGVGKTSIVYGLAKRALRGQTQREIRYFRVLSLDIGTLIAGTKDRGEIEERLRQILHEVRSAGNVILFIDEVQNVAGGLIVDRPVDLTGLLIETLSSPKVHLVATVTPANLRRYLEARPTFYDLFEKVEVVELSKRESVRVLSEIASLQEADLKITIPYKTIVTAVELSYLYLKDSVLPGKAINLLEEAAVSAKSNGEKVLSKEVIEKLITQKTKVPVGKLQEQEEGKLLGLEEVLHQRVVDQDQAITAVANALRRSRTMVRQQNRPIGTFLFLGPTGVGKTQTAKTLAASYFGAENTMLRFDMSEFANPNGVDLLIGALQGNTQAPGQLTEAVKNRPFALILLDELEKADRQVLNLFLQVFDDGRLVDVDGKVINFFQTIIIATSNAGSELIRERIRQQKPIERIKIELLEFLQKEQIFPPEFLNRFDEVVVFKPLTLKETEEVTIMLVGELDLRLKKQDLSLELLPKAQSLLAKIGYDPVYGARPLRRAIQDQIESPLAKFILSHQIKRGQTLVVDEQKEVFTFSVKKGKFED